MQSYSKIEANIFDTEEDVQRLSKFEKWDSGKWE